MKIILSTDFSEENKVLLPYAIDFLKDAGGEIIIFHAYMDNVFVGSNSYPGIDPYIPNNNVKVSKMDVLDVYSRANVL